MRRRNIRARRENSDGRLPIKRTDPRLRHVSAHRARRTLGTLCAVLTLSAAAHADRAFRTDNPYQLGLYRWEFFGGIEIAAGTWRGIQSREDITFNTGFDYGLTERSEVGLSADFYRFRNPGADGLGDAILHYKHRIKEATPSVPDIAIDYRLKIPTASKSRGLGTGKPDLGIIALLGWKREPWETSLRLGRVFTGDESEPGRYEMGLATRYHASEVTHFLGEIFLDAKERVGDAQRREISFGFARQIGMGAWMDAMIGVGFSESAPDVTVRIGASSRL